MLKGLCTGRILVPNLTSHTIMALLSRTSLRVNKLKHLTEMVISLNELDNTDNLENGIPSNASFTYYVPDVEDFARFEPKTPQYKELKIDNIVSLTLRITDQNDSIITNGPGVTLVLHIR